MTKIGIVICDRYHTCMSVVRTLIAEGHLVETTYDGYKFYSRKLKGVSMYG